MSRFTNIPMEAVTLRIPAAVVAELKRRALELSSPERRIHYTDLLRECAAGACRDTAGVPAGESR